MKFNEFRGKPMNSSVWIGIFEELKEFYEIQGISKKSYEFQGLNLNMGGNTRIIWNSMNFKGILWILVFELEYGRK